MVASVMYFMFIMEISIEWINNFYKQKKKVADFCDIFFPIEHWLNISWN